MRDFVLLKPTYWKQPFWVEDIEPEYWRNYNGGRVPKEESDQILGRASVKHLWELDWYKTGLVDPGSDNGWLSPTGTFIGCASHAHDDVVHLVLHTQVGLLEKQGWCRVYVNYFSCYRHLTPEQRNWLLYHGHRVGEED